MASGQYLTPNQQRIVNRYYGGADARIGLRLTELISDIAVCDDAKKVGPLWQSVHTQLKSTPADQMKAARIVSQRDVVGLAKLVEDLSKGTFVAEKKPEAPAPVIAAPAAESGPTVASLLSAPGAGPSHADMKAALAAFKKRLKIQRLDEESKLGGRAMTGGKKSAIVAIQPPAQFSKAIWDALVKDGKLKYSGSGLYELVGALSG